MIADHTAGTSQGKAINWVGLKPKEIQQKLEDQNYEVSYYIIHQLLDKAGLKKRSYLKDASPKDVPFLDAGLPVFSLDAKHKELLGNFHRNGQYYDFRHRKVNDHDFRSQADGIFTPHGLYDIGDNFGYLTLGLSKDTSEFLCDNIETFWKSDLQWKYSTADWMLLLCDGGGSNNSRHYIVKQDLYQLAQRLEMNIVVAHYPPYCSKWNPIEHRLFAQVHKAWEGTIFHNIRIAKERAEMTSTKTGLGVKVNISHKEYLTKRNVNPLFKSNIQDYVIFDQQLPQWNYRFAPS